jgi:hypothetical protein
MSVSETAVRLAAFVTMFSAMALWEVAAPRHQRPHSQLTRWPSNLAVAGLNALATRIMMPSTAAGLALLGARRAWGLLTICPFRHGAKSPHPYFCWISRFICNT